MMFLFEPSFISVFSEIFSQLHGFIIIIILFIGVHTSQFINVFDPDVCVTSSIDNTVKIYS